MTAYSQAIMDGVICWLLFGIAAGVVVICCMV